MLAKAYGLRRGFNAYFIAKKKEGKTGFFADIAVHHHIFMHPETFALLKLNLKYGCRRVGGCLGRKFDAESAINPKTNAFHPDMITQEQKIRWSGG